MHNELKVGIHYMKMGFNMRWPCQSHRHRLQVILSFRYAYVSKFATTISKPILKDNYRRTRNKFANNNKSGDANAHRTCVYCVHCTRYTIKIYGASITCRQATISIMYQVLHIFCVFGNIFLIFKRLFLV